MSNKLLVCCFCKLAADPDYGAIHDETGKYLCVDCVVEIYSSTLDQIKEAEMNDSVKED
jgi:hypothetical protein